MALHHLAIHEVNLGVDAQAANDACDRILRHLYKL